jgi:hypothetical protein
MASDGGRDFPIWLPVSKSCWAARRQAHRNPWPFLLRAVPLRTLTPPIQICLTMSTFLSVIDGEPERFIGKSPGINPFRDAMRF